MHRVALCRRLSCAVEVTYLSLQIFQAPRVFGTPFWDDSARI